MKEIKISNRTFKLPFKTISEWKEFDRYFTRVIKSGKMEVSEDGYNIYSNSNTSR